MVIASPRKSFRTLRTVPLEFEDEKIQLLATAVKQLQEIALKHPVNVAAISGDATLTDDQLLANVDSSAASRTITLPSAVGRDGRRLIVKKADSETTTTVTVTPDGSETVDGQTGMVLVSPWSGLELASDGSNWIVVSLVGYVENLTF